MKTINIIRAWKYADYRQNLSEADRAKLPAHPAGMIDGTTTYGGTEEEGVVFEITP